MFRRHATGWILSVWFFSLGTGCFKRRRFFAKIDQKCQFWLSLAIFLEKRVTVGAKLITWCDRPNLWLLPEKWAFQGHVRSRRSGSLKKAPLKARHFCLTLTQVCTALTRPYLGGGVKKYPPRFFLNIFRTIRAGPLKFSVAILTSIWRILWNFYQYRPVPTPSITQNLNQGPAPSWKRIYFDALWYGSKFQVFWTSEKKNFHKKRLWT